jgi:hemerythrin
MSSSLQWCHEFEIGVADIDFQHHYFLDLINRLSEELGRNDNLEFHAALIAELNAYVSFHFISEENMMCARSYPGLEAHRQMHYDLLEQLSVREGRLALDDSAGEVDRIIRFLVDWFLHHTITQDKQFAEFLHRQTAQGDGVDAPEGTAIVTDQAKRGL